MTEPQQAAPAQAEPSQAEAEARQFRTVWLSSGKTPLRQFLHTETGSATILFGATLAAVAWSNLAPGSYAAFWGTALAARVAGHGIAMSLGQFVNSGLMALFFLVVGLEARREYGDLRFVFRHLPLSEVHPHAQLAAEAAEAAARQGSFWEMHDLLLDHQGALDVRDLVQYAAEIGLDTEKFRDDLRKHAGASRIAEDVDSADLAVVSGTPTFFINGNRYHGAFDLTALQEAVHTAKGRAILGARQAR